METGFTNTSDLEDKWTAELALVASVHKRTIREKFDGQVDIRDGVSKLVALACNAVIETAAAEILKGNPVGVEAARGVLSRAKRRAVDAMFPQSERDEAARLLQLADAMESIDGTTIKTVVLRCDGLDACAIEAAIKVRSGYGILPDYDGDEDAATLAEACRAYLEQYDSGDAYKAAIKAAGLDEEDTEAAPCGQ